MRVSLIVLAAAGFTEAISTPCYDYVVIGGGTAGLTVANRLMEDRHVTVAVLEAGFNAEGLPEVFVPGLIGTGPSTLNWAYRTVPQTNLNGHVLTVNAGRALGGSTIINSMIFPRTEKEQYDAWGEPNNDRSWTWNNFLPFFKKSELFTPPTKFQSGSGGRYLPSVHGFAGRVKVGFPNFYFPQSSLWRKAAEGLGIPASPDLSATPMLWGLRRTRSMLRIILGECSAACAYYTPFQNRPNLVVITNATVTRIVWKKSKVGSKLEASGVEYLVNNLTKTVSLSREIILSEGTIGHPKVLELSGVRNSTILKAAGVTPVLDLRTVGENCADHVHSWANAFTNTSLTKDVLLLNLTFAAEQRTLWFKNRTGLYSAAPRSLSIAAPSDTFTKSQMAALIAEAQSDCNLVNYAEQFSNGNPALAKGIAAQHRLALARTGLLGTHQLHDPASAQLHHDQFHSIYATIPWTDHITSSNPLTPPAVDPAYWSHPIDIAAQQPGVEKDTDAKIEDWLRSVVASDNHEVGSLSMMPRSLGGVIDTSLKVYGTANVRVADASVIPFPLSAHLSSTVYMIGEHAADIIRS
ncbi:alcohol oxidase [Mycena rebaudengoi]|nr:alcohol oxidase [Mycena rebaudengoi]